MAYLQAVMGNVFGKLTWEHASHQHNNTLDIPSMAGQIPVHPCPVQTLQSACHQLGIDPNVYIIQYVICLLCWKHHIPLDMNNLVSLICEVCGCDGELFTINNRKCIPSLINPQVLVIDSLQQTFMCPGFAKLVMKWNTNQATITMKNLSCETSLMPKCGTSLWSTLGLGLSDCIYYMYCTLQEVIRGRGGI
jgi:hypothetical protein